METDSDVDDADVDDADVDVDDGDDAVMDVVNDDIDAESDIKSEESKSYSDPDGLFDDSESESDDVVPVQPVGRTHTTTESELNELFDGVPVIPTSLPVPVLPSTLRHIKGTNRYCNPKNKKQVYEVKYLGGV